MSAVKYSCTSEINLPMNKVVRLWKDENNFSEWQDGFVKIEHVSGKPGTVGAKSKIIYQQGKKKIELHETIVNANLPYDKTALYEHKHMTNMQTTSFKPLGDSKTQHISKVKYTKFNGIVPKLMSRLFPGLFKRQSQKWMNQFKVFAEKTALMRNKK